MILSIQQYSIEREFSINNLNVFLNKYYPNISRNINDEGIRIIHSEEWNNQVGYIHMEILKYNDSIKKWFVINKWIKEDIEDFIKTHIKSDVLRDEIIDEIINFEE